MLFTGGSLTRRLLGFTDEPEEKLVKPNPAQRTMKVIRL